MTSIPRDSADFANSNSRSGVRWAETILVSCGTPNSPSTSAAFLMVSQSDLLPMITETRGTFLFRFTFIWITDDRPAPIVLLCPAPYSVDKAYTVFARALCVLVPNAVPPKLHRIAETYWAAVLVH